MCPLVAKGAEKGDKINFCRHTQWQEKREKQKQFVYKNTVFNIKIHKSPKKIKKIKGKSQLNVEICNVT